MPPYPLIEVVLTVGSWEVVAEALPDTGSDGGVAIPAGAGREVLAAPELVDLQLGDGSSCAVLAWEGSAAIEDRLFRVEVVALGRDYLLGRRILDQLEICFEFGERVRLRFDRSP